MFTPAASLAITLPDPLNETDFRPWTPAKAQLGQLLFYDKLLSGNRNIACATCHHPKHASGDGLALGIGEGGNGLGPERDLGMGAERVLKRVPRNATALFNLGAKEFTSLFHDGRLTVSPSDPGGFNSPAEEFLPLGLNSLVAAQALFPLLSKVEMAGDASENEVAGASRRSPLYGWRIIAERVAHTPDYWPLFQAAWPELNSTNEISIVHIANALDDFINAEWRADQSPFDHYLRGDAGALSAQQRQGMSLFYGEAGCSSCHSGALQTDHDFHALAIPPLGPGRTRLFDPIARDRGRINETDLDTDAYRFRTPSLRNVTETGPWGHNGAYASLDGIVRHHLDPMAALKHYDKSQVVMKANAQLRPELDFIIWQDTREMARFRGKLDIEPSTLTEQQIAALIEFLHALKDKKSLKGTYGVPSTVPSNLSLDR